MHAKSMLPSSRIVRPWDDATRTRPTIVRPWESPIKNVCNISPVNNREQSRFIRSALRKRIPHSRSLGETAVEIMEQWYQRNEDHPYLSAEVASTIAEEGDITTLQVRRWMDNKRTRSFNTLSYNNCVHPKRLKRLQRDAAKPTQSLPHDHFYQLKRLQRERATKPTQSWPLKHVIQLIGLHKTNVRHFSLDTQLHVSAQSMGSCVLHPDYNPCRSSSA